MKQLVKAQVPQSARRSEAKLIERVRWLDSDLWSATVVAAPTSRSDALGTFRRDLIRLDDPARLRAC